MVLIYPKSITFLYALIIQYTRGFCSVLTPPRNKAQSTIPCKCEIFILKLQYEVRKKMEFVKEKIEHIFLKITFSHL